MRRALILALFLCLGCSKSNQPETVVSDSGLEREIQGFQLSETHEGKPIWELHAAKAWRIPQDTHDHLENVEVLFYDENGKLDSRLTARNGVVDENVGQMTAQNNVKLISIRGDTLTTQELNYFKNEDRVRGPGFVRLAKPDRVLTGFEFEAKPDLSTYEIHRDVHISLKNNRTDIVP
jgi:LPS export ABC transporter protein LptC